jgi:ribosomal protein S18 acetylase RimI-like enzyme
MSVQQESPVTVRLATPEDYAAVEEMTVSVYVSEGYTQPERANALRDTARRAKDTDLFVAVDSASGKVLGSVSVMTVHGPLSQIAGDGEAEMRLLGVDPAARGRGAGEALVRACLDRARAAGMAHLVLSTQPTMTAAHRLYERLGFARMPERDWSRQSGARMLVYTRELGVGG